MAKSTSVYIDDALDLILPAKSGVFGSVSAALRVSTLRYASLVEDEMDSIKKAFTAQEISFLRMQKSMVKKNSKSEFISIISDVRRMKTPAESEGSVSLTVLVKKIEQLSRVQQFALIEFLAR